MHTLLKKLNYKAQSPVLLLNLPTEKALLNVTNTISTEIQVGRLWVNLAWNPYVW